MKTLTSAVLAAAAVCAIVTSAIAAEPLVPTLVPRVYANRFGAPGKTIWTILNARGHTVDAPVLNVGQAPHARVSDLLTGRELPVAADGSVRMRLRRDECRVVARMDGPR